MITYAKLGILYFLNRVLNRLVGILKMGDIDEWFISPARTSCLTGMSRFIDAWHSEVACPSSLPACWGGRSPCNQTAYL